MTLANCSRLSRANVPSPYSWLFILLFAFLGMASTRAAGLAPVISGLTNTTISEDSKSNLVVFRVRDDDTDLGVATNLNLSATSSSPTIIGNEGLVLGVSGTNRTLRVTPKPNAFGAALLRIQAIDSTGLSNVAQFTVTVTNVNDPPAFSIASTSLSGQEDASRVVSNFLTGVSVGPNETEGASFLISSSNPSLFGTNGISVSGTGTNRNLIYKPSPNASGTNVVTLVLTDGQLTATNIFTISIAAINDAPVLERVESLIMNEDTVRTNSFSLRDVDSTELTLVATSTATNLLGGGTNGLAVSLEGTNARVMVKPLANAFGTGTVVLVASDGRLSATNTFGLTVSNVNDPPTFSISTNNLSSSEDVSVVVSNFVTEVSAGPKESETVTLILSSSNTELFPSNGITLTGTGTKRNLSYKPQANATGTNLVTLILSDGSLSATNRFSIVVTPVNDAPIISGLEAIIMAEETTRTNGFTVRDADSASLVLTATSTATNLLGGGTNGLVVSLSGTNARIVVRPLANSFGTATILVVASDGSASATNFLSLTVTNVNDPPTFSLSTSSQESAEDTAVVVTNFVTGVSPGPKESEAVTFTLTSSNPELFASNGISLTGEGAVRNLSYKPLTNATGTNVVTVVLSDKALAATNRFIIVVNRVNDAPIIGKIESITMNEDTARTNLFDVRDVDSASVTLTATSTATNLLGGGTNGLTANLSGTNGRVVIRPLANAYGTATVVVVANDGAVSKTNTFTVTVANVNDRPSFTLSTTNIRASSGAKTISGFVTSVSAGPNEQTQTVKVLVVSNTAPSLFTVLPSITGSGTNLSLSFTAKTNVAGSGVILIRATDNGGTNAGGIYQSETASVLITITNSLSLARVADGLSLPAPMARIDSVRIDPGGTVRLDISNPSGADFQIEASDDLSNWTLLSGSRGNAPHSEFSDAAGGRAARFYRLVTPPTPNSGGGANE